MTNNIARIRQRIATMESSLSAARRPTKAERDATCAAWAAGIGQRLRSGETIDAITDDEVGRLLSDLPPVGTPGRLTDRTQIKAAVRATVTTIADEVAA